MCVQGHDPLTFLCCRHFSSSFFFFFVCLLLFFCLFLFILFLVPSIFSSMVIDFNGVW